MVAARFGEEYVAEIRSIAKHSGQPLSHVVLGNLMYDACQMGGIMGVVSAMCPGKWAVTINQAPMKGAASSYFQWPVLQRLRHVCDTMGSYRDVVAGLQEYQTMTSFFAHVIGTKPTQHAVITGLGNSFRRRGMKRSNESRALVQTNHIIGHKDVEEHNRPERWKDENDAWWYCDSQYRAKSLTERLTSVPRTLAEAQKKICTSAVTTLDTMQQMVLQPASGYSRV